MLFVNLKAGGPDDEDRENEDEGYEREEHSCDGARGEVKPEDFLRAISKERDETENRGQHREHQRIDLMVISLYISSRLVF